MNNTVIIVAGGSGIRMGSEIPKQFLLIRNKPLLMHTIQRFYDFDNKITIILVLPQKQISLWESLCKTHSFTISHQVIEGGETRFHSVKNGLFAVKEKSVVGIHDGVRPFVSLITIRNCFAMAARKGNAVPVIPVNESVRIFDAVSNHAFDRSRLRLVQTPQVFKYEILEKGFKQEYEEKFTDDANVVEAAGFKIHLVEGNRENIKITTQTDLVLAEGLLRILEK